MPIVASGVPCSPHDHEHCKTCFSRGVRYLMSDDLWSATELRGDKPCTITMCCGMLEMYVSYHKDRAHHMVHGGRWADSPHMFLVDVSSSTLGGVPK